MIGVPTLCYLGVVHIVRRDDQFYRRQRGQKRNITVQQFREEESKRVEEFWLPYLRFVARRHLEIECQTLTLWRQREGKTEVRPANREQ